MGEVKDKATTGKTCYVFNHCTIGWRSLIEGANERS